MNTQTPIDVLTPAAAAYLFQRAGETIRGAVHTGKVKSPVTLTLTGKVIRLIALESALTCWTVRLPAGAPPMEETLVLMRDFGFPISVEGQLFHILHPYPAASRESMLPDAE